MWTQESKLWLITLIVGILGIIESKVGVIFPADWLPYLQTISEIIALVGALLKISPLPREKWTSAKRTVEAMKKFGPLIVLVLALPLVLLSCGHGPDPKTNPVGAIAYNADQVAQLMGHAEKLIMAAEAAQPPILTTDIARTILRACRLVDEKNLELADALEKLDTLPLDDFAQRKPLLAKVSLALDVMNVAIFEVIKPIKDEALKQAVTDVVRQVARLLMLISVPGLDMAVREDLAYTYWRLAA